MIFFAYCLFGFFIKILKFAVIKSTIIYFKQCVCPKCLSQEEIRCKGQFSAFSKIAKAIFYLVDLIILKKMNHIFLHPSLPVKTTNCCNEITQACHAAF